MKILPTLFIVGMLLPGFALADEAMPFTPPPAPPQEYHNVNGDNPSLATPAVAAPSAAAVSASVDAADKSVSIVTNTQKEITDLTQNTLNFEQQANQRIQDLVDSNHAMGAAILVLQQQMLSGAASPKASSFLHGFRDPEAEGFLLGASVIFLLGTGVLFGRLWRSRARVKNMPMGAPLSSALSVPSADHAEAEYDFMSSSQAIPAKLDLARSYIAMNDLDQARSILKAVIEKGDDAQRNEAGALLRKL